MKYIVYDKYTERKPYLDLMGAQPRLSISGINEF